MTPRKTTKQRLLVVGGLFLILLVTCRTRLLHADCETMFQWGFDIGHSEQQDDLLSGCAAARGAAGTYVDISNITITPLELEAAFAKKEHDKQDGIGGTDVPRIFHQSYVSNVVFGEVYPFIKSWHDGLSRYTDWKFVWWTDDSLRWLVHTHYPEYVQVWENLPHSIMRADSGRYFLLHRYGGLYADMDIEYVNSKYTDQPDTVALEDWFQKNGQTSSSSGQGPYGAYLFNECNENAMMASPPNSQFWEIVIQEWTNAAKNPWIQTVHKVTGIEMLKDVCENENRGIKIATPKYGIFETHHGTNTWRWKTKRDDWVRIVDAIILAYLAIGALFMARHRLEYFLVAKLGRRFLAKEKTEPKYELGVGKNGAAMPKVLTEIRTW